MTNAKIQHFLPFRKAACGPCACEVDKSDPCAECPKNRWKASILCRGPANQRASAIVAKSLPRLPSQPTQVSLKVPTNATMAKTALASLSRWAGNGFKQADEKVFEQRMATCRECEYWNQQGFNNSGRCMKCGCSTWIKLRMATEKCPINKW